MTGWLAQGCPCPRCFGPTELRPDQKHRWCGACGFWNVRQVRDELQKQASVMAAIEASGERA